MMAGRVAEETCLGKVTTGAGNDFEQATVLARKMVCEWGMSELGPLTFGKKEEAIFLGREIAQHRDYSEDTAIRIDQEVKKIVNQAYQQARQIIDEKRDALEAIAQSLLEREVLDAAEINLLIEGKPLPEKPLAPPPAAEQPAEAPAPAKGERKPAPAFGKGGEKPAPA